jgi:hypothetical protein
MPYARAVVVVLALVLVTRSLGRADDAPATQPGKVQPVDFRRLQELMPPEAAGVQRSNLDGQNVSVGEMNISQASANYTKPDSDGSDPNASIQISDYVASPQMVAGMTAWRTVPIRIENDQGYQRTTKVKEMPAFESFTRDGDTRQMMLLVAERFLVQVETSHVPEAQFKNLIDGLPIEKLAALR